MERKTQVKKFNIVFDNNMYCDIDLLEQQVHSLYKYENIIY